MIFIVCGGGWRWGGKAMSRVVENKMARWAPRGFIFISINYCLLPDATPLQQAEDVARAQRKAASWGSDPAKFILIGHSRALIWSRCWPLHRLSRARPLARRGCPRQRGL